MKEYMTTPEAFMATLTANPACKVVYSTSFNMFFVIPEDDADEFSLLMAGAFVFRGDPDFFLDIPAVQDIIAQWKDPVNVALVKQAIEDTKSQRQQAGKKPLKMR